MPNRAPEDPAALLSAMIQLVFEADHVGDVRDAIAHGARMISPYAAMTMRENGSSRAYEVTLRRGDELDATAKALERHLSQDAASTKKTMSTLDRFASEQTQALADSYVRRYGLCIARPLLAYGESVGVAATHYEGRTALGEAEFDTLRRFFRVAAVALFNARARQDLREFAYTDPLTGLASRRRLDVELGRHVDGDLSLLMIDFDGLKVVNDSLGYDRGDVLIQTVGSVLAMSVEPGELAARLGGDEFVIVLAKADSAAARQRAEELTAVLDRLTVPDELQTLFHGASVGYATAEPGEDSRSVLRRASAEMRSRKRRRKSDRDGRGGHNPGPGSHRPEY